MADYENGEEKELDLSDDKVVSKYKAAAEICNSELASRILRPHHDRRLQAVVGPPWLPLGCRGWGGGGAGTASQQSQARQRLQEAQQQEHAPLLLTDGCVARGVCCRGCCRVRVLLRRRGDRCCGGGLQGWRQGGGPVQAGRRHHQHVSVS